MMKTQLCIASCRTRTLKGKSRNLINGKVLRTVSTANSKIEFHGQCLFHFGEIQYRMETKSDYDVRTGAQKQLADNKYCCLCQNMDCAFSVRGCNWRATVKK